MKAPLDLVALYHYTKLVDWATALSEQGWTVNLVFCSDGIPFMDVRKKQK